MHAETQTVMRALFSAYIAAEVWSDYKFVIDAELAIQLLHNAGIKISVLC